MKKFVFLSHSYEVPTKEVQEAWGKWFAAIQNSIVDMGSPFKAGKEVTSTQSKTLSPEMHPATGYCILQAENMDEAEKLLEGCPIGSSMRIYELARS